MISHTSQKSVRLQCATHRGTSRHFTDNIIIFIADIREIKFFKDCKVDSSLIREYGFNMNYAAKWNGGSKSGM